LKKKKHQKRRVLLRPRAICRKRRNGGGVEKKKCASTNSDLMPDRALKVGRPFTGGYRSVAGKNSHMNRGGKAPGSGFGLGNLLVVKGRTPTQWTGLHRVHEYSHSVDSFIGVPVRPGGAESYKTRRKR